MSRISMRSALRTAGFRRQPQLTGRRFGTGLLGAILATWTALLPSEAIAANKELKNGAFAIEHTLVLPGSPEVIYDAITGDISGWWDHTFSGKPAKFYIEAKPGGGFWEIFDESGDGVKHGEVIFAQRGKLLRFNGPLGLSGHAVQMVCTYEFQASGQDSTRLNFTGNVAGEFDASWPAAIDGVWHHFLVARFKPYVEAGQYKPKQPDPKR